LSISLAIASVGGATIPSSINFAASGAPQGSIVTFTPQTLPSGSGSTGVTLTIQPPEIIGKVNNPNIQSGTALAMVALGGLNPALPARKATSHQVRELARRHPSPARQRRCHDRTHRLRKCRLAANTQLLR